MWETGFYLEAPPTYTESNWRAGGRLCSGLVAGHIFYLGVSDHPYQNPFEVVIVTMAIFIQMGH